MAVDFREGKVTDPKVCFLTKNLKKLNYSTFREACIACMTESPKYRALLDIPTSEEYLLYRGKGEALIKVRNWSGYLTLLCVSKSGTWIESSHIGGTSQEDVIKEAWKHITRAKPLINKEFEKVKWS